jgi:hypothetical protein
MNIASGLSNYGLITKGMNMGREDDQSLALGEQKVASGKLGLEAQQREAGDQEAMRSAYADAMASGHNAVDSLDNMALAAAQRGRPQDALQLRQLRDQMFNQGAPNLVHQVMSDDRPGERQDLIEQVRRIPRFSEATRVVNDGQGTLSIFLPGQESQGPQKLSIPMLGTLTGQFKPTQTKIAAGETVVQQTPGMPAGWKAPGGVGGTSVYRAPEKTNLVVRDGWVVDTSGQTPPRQLDMKDYEIKDVVQGNQTVTMAINKRNPLDRYPVGEAGPRTGLQTGVHMNPLGGTIITPPGGGAMEIQPGQPGKPAQTHLFSPDEPATPGTPSRAVPIQGVSGQPPATPPVQGARLAPDGKYYVPDPSRPGKYLQVAQGNQGAAVPPASPAAAPYQGADGNWYQANPDGSATQVPEPDASVAAAAGAGAASQGNTAPATASATQTRPAPPSAPAKPSAQPVSAPPSVSRMASQTNGGRKFETDLEAKDQTLKRLGNLVRLNVGDPNLDFQYWMNYVNRAKQLGSKNYARGGKVQRCGL